MLSRSIPAIPWHSNRQFELAVEGFALSYLASYNGNDLYARVRPSFERAWGMTDFEFFPRVGNQPCFIACYWRDREPFRIHVGIEGAVSATAAIRYSDAGWTQPTGCVGHVATNANTYAVNLKTTLLARPVFRDLWNTADTKLNISGYSLGGAVGEVLSVLMMKDKPQRQVSYASFGSPRVGTSAWASSDQLPRLRNNYYCGNDPCNHIPWYTDQTVCASIARPTAPIIAAFAPNRPTDTYNLKGEAIPEYSRLFATANAYTDAPRALTTESVWYWHQMDAYRLMFTNLCARQLDALHYRFRYLEFPGENQWGYRFWRGTENFPALAGSAPPGPDVDPDLPNDQQQVLVEGTSVGGRDDDWEGGGGGDDDHAPEVRRVLVNPHRAVPLGRSLRTRQR